jgi:hypothetical protein
MSLCNQDSKNVQIKATEKIRGSYSTVTDDSVFWDVDTMSLGE